MGGGGATTQGWINKKNARQEYLLQVNTTLTQTLFSINWNCHDLFKLNCLKFYFKYKHNEVPVYFKNYEFIPNDETHYYPTRHGDIIPANVTRTSQFQKCIRHHLPKLINETPNQFLEKIWTHNFHGFSEYIKRYYIDNYPLTCTVENCYICRHS